MTERVALVRGVGSHNGGAELLLKSATLALSPSWRIAADARRMSRSVRRAWGVEGYWDVPKLGPYRSVGVNLLPSKMTSSFGAVAERHVNAVFDASGFFLGDQWNAQSIERDATGMRRIAERGAPVVMLPQAFGPFTRPPVASAAKRLLENAGLVYARDSVSREHLVTLLGEDERLRIAPDITIALDATSTHPTAQSVVAVVPNVNIVARHKSPDARSGYVASLVAICRGLGEIGLEPVLLAHSSHGDPAILDEVSRISPSVRIAQPRNGLEAKTFIASCAGVIAGRYHAIVSALSQGVPAVAHSWSHKYGELLADFGTTRGLADPFSAENSVSLLEELLQDAHYAQELQKRRLALRERVGAMWQEIDRYTKGAA